MATRKYCPVLAGVYEDTRDLGTYLLVTSGVSDEFVEIEVMSCDEDGVCLGEDEYLYVTPASAFGKRVGGI